MNIVPWKPFDELTILRKEMDSLSGTGSFRKHLSMKGM